MPKETFYNLPEDKRERILDASLSEFSEYNFGEASVARIIKNSGIAAGSFYQYFDNKLDLYKELMHSVQDMKMKYLAPVLKDTDTPFFSFFKDLYHSAIKFASENPRMENLGRRLMNDKELLSTAMKELEPWAMEFYGQLLKRGIASNDIRKDIDIDFTAFFLYRTGAFLSEYILKDRSDITDPKKEIDAVIDLIQNGIGVK